jgi:hypothetical protein
LSRFYAQPVSKWQDKLREDRSKLADLLEKTASGQSIKWHFWLKLFSSPIGGPALRVLKPATLLFSYWTKLLANMNRWWQGTLRRRNKHPVMRNLVFYPAPPDQEALDDLYFRSAWYLNAFGDQLQRIVIPVHDGMRPDDKCPPLLDSAIESILEKQCDKYQFPDAGDQRRTRFALRRTDAVLLRARPDDSPLIASLPLGKPYYNVDHRQVNGADSVWLSISSFGMGNNDAEIADCCRRFAELATCMRADTGYVMGTGPGLAQLSDHEFSDGLCIACNTMVKNKPLMERMQPRLIVMGDPIFHAGCSTFAGELRAHLIETMRRHNSVLIVPWRDYRTYRANLPGDLRSRIIGIPFEDGKLPNFNLLNRFSVTTTSNILTLFLLPLAGTFFKTVRIGGCDGRPFSENNYFWGHDPASQFTDKLEDLKAAHPGFFKISYDDYYLEHCETLGRWLEAMEAEGHSLEVLTPSHIPGLSQRETTTATQMRLQMPGFGL